MRSRKRKLQQVSTKQFRATVVKWMETDRADNGVRGCFARCIRQFPHGFSGSSVANAMKAKRWWINRDNILAVAMDRVAMVSVNHRQCGVQKKVLLKAAAGRGRKRQPWVEWLYTEIVDHFNGYRKSGVKFSPKLLRRMAIDIIGSSTHPDFPPGMLHNGKPISDAITLRWIQRCMEANNIVGRAQTGKLMVSPARQAHINKSVAFHLGVVGREFQSGLVDENLVENCDETHFVVNMDNGKTLGFRGDNDVKYADVVSGGIGMTMMVRLTGGPGARIQSPFIIFQNANGSYPIRGVCGVLAICRIFVLLNNITFQGPR